MPPFTEALLSFDGENGNPNLDMDAEKTMPSALFGFFCPRKKGHADDRYENNL